MGDRLSVVPRSNPLCQRNDLGTRVLACVMCLVRGRPVRYTQPTVERCAYDCGMSASRPWASEAEIARVLVPVLLALVQHLLHVGTGLRELDVLELNVGAAPTIHVAGSRVVRRQGGHLIAVVALDQVAQVVRPIADVDL